MDALRVSLLIIGIAIITGIYLLGRRKLDTDDKRLQLFPSFPWTDIFSRLRTLIRMPKLALPVKKKHDAERPQPVSDELDEDDLELLNHIVTDRQTDEVDVDDVSLIVELTTEQIAPAGEQLFIPVTINAHTGERFSGEAIMQATEQLAIKLGDDGVFRYAMQDAQGYEQALLGLANIMEPGTFDADNMHSFETPGLVLYLHLPAPVEPREAFDKLIDVSRELAALLGGDLCDETRSVLTNQTIGHLKEKVEAYRFKQKMTQLKQHRP